MTDLGGIEIAGGIGVALAIGAAGSFLLIKLGDAIGREIDAFFGVGGHWAHERRTDDDAADRDESVSHGERNGAETAGLTSCKADLSAGVIHSA